MSQPKIPKKLVNLTAEWEGRLRRAKGAPAASIKRARREMKRMMRYDHRWNQSVEARDEVWNRSMVHLGLLRSGESDMDARFRSIKCAQAAMEDHFPGDYGKDLGDDGAWVQITTPPDTSITVPPFSIWFAQWWPFDEKPMAGETELKRAKIITPQGTLGIFPHEYAIVDVARYIGCESEGVRLHQLGGEPVVNKDHLHYVMSRGISRRNAMLLLINQIKDLSFLWLEFAPQYGEFFGKEWPTHERCPFATRRDLWTMEPNNEAKLPEVYA